MPQQLVVTDFVLILAVISCEISFRNTLRFRSRESIPRVGRPRGRVGRLFVSAKKCPGFFVARYFAIIRPLRRRASAETA